MGAHDGGGDPRLGEYPGESHGREGGFVLLRHLGEGLQDAVAASTDVVQPGVGDLVISEIMPDSSATLDAVGEWFEVVATGSFDLNGVVLGNEPGNPKVNIVDPACLGVNAGDRLLFARSSDPLVNGGLPTPDFTFSFGLTNSSSSIFVGVGDTVIDSVVWTSSSADTFSLGCSATGMPRPLSEMETEPSTWIATLMREQ